MTKDPHFPSSPKQINEQPSADKVNAALDAARASPAWCWGVLALSALHVMRARKVHSDEPVYQRESFVVLGSSTTFHVRRYSRKVVAKVCYCKEKATSEA